VLTDQAHLTRAYAPQRTTPGRYQRELLREPEVLGPKRKFAQDSPLSGAQWSSAQALSRDQNLTCQPAAPHR